MNRDTHHIALITAMVLINACFAQINPQPTPLHPNVSKSKILFVDDNGPADSIPFDSSWSDPNENGTELHPYDTIQEAIDAASEGDIIHVQSGTYRENISLSNKTIDLIGIDTGPPVIEGTGYGPIVTMDNTHSDCRLSGFILTLGQDSIASALFAYNSFPILKNCFIIGNRSAGLPGIGATLTCVDSHIQLTNCTIADNSCESSGGLISLIDSRLELSNSIVWNNFPDEIHLFGSSQALISYCNISPNAIRQVPAYGINDTFNEDPLFARTGAWLEPGVGTGHENPTSPHWQWIPGDYSLLSTGGRWSPESRSWVVDEQTSPCINAGNPLVPVAEEPSPHGQIINMGAWGGTTRASKSPVDLQAPIDFKDPHLKARIEEKLWVLDPTPIDMLSLTDLVCINDEIKYLDGLEWATNLQSLWIRFCQVEDISLLSRLSQLQYLNLSQNDIADLSPLSGLINLVHLNLHANDIRDISALSGLTRLEYLELRKNPVDSISTISNLTNLLELNLNQLYTLRDITPLAGLTKLEYLHLNCNKINDISVIQNFSNLVELDLSRNEIGGISELTSLEQLQWLDISENKLDEDVYQDGDDLTRILENNPGIDLSYDPLN
jgi:hypothetical protein